MQSISSLVTALIAVFGFLTAAACGPVSGISAQENYTYAGCEGDDSVTSCPGSAIVRCAFKAIREKHATCSVHLDCVRQEVDTRCSSWGDCAPVFVNADAREAFLAEIKVEVDAYCRPAGELCFESALCQVDSSTVGRCVDGLCQAR
ncbi:MAG: hypothetical protein WBV82_10775 [Myxococcaceae bacterium]